uniref:Uncharacterized protein n=1 Tax=Anguilla anguilla TaxID=7936 RepID=A0A0E9S5Q7_ANGAN
MQFHFALIISCAILILSKLRSHTNNKSTKLKILTETCSMW